MKYLLIISLTLLHFNSFAQKETFDLISYTLPTDSAGMTWKKEVTENITSYTIINKTNWCRINVIKSTISKGSIEQDFDSEWQELVVKNYKPDGAPQTSEALEAEGWKIKSGGAKFIFNKADAIALLTTFSGYERCVSVVLLTNSKEYVKYAEAFNGTIELAKPATNSNQTTGENSIIGSWKVSASNNSSDRMKNGTMNYISRQYNFNEDGTYYFLSKAFDPLMQNMIFGKETGTYQINGNTISVNPSKSTLQAWSKKDGTDKWGKLINTQNLSLEKATYQFTKHYFSGIQTWNLVLQSDKTTKRDGPYSNNDLFKNAWYYAPISSNNPVIELPPGQQMTTGKTKKDPVVQTAVVTAASGKNGFAFTTSNFDDGWTSTAKEDWVETKKGGITVLIHYPNTTVDKYIPDVEEGLKNAWNILVAPKYSSASNMQFKPLHEWQTIEFAEADMIEKGTGKSVHVVFFKKNYSGGSGRYLEFITADKKTFEQEFGSYDANKSSGTGEGWDKIAAMANYNKFAVAASDLKGKWTSNFTGMTQYVNAITGANAGIDTYASNQNYEFTGGNSYKWDIVVASGMVGNLKFQNVKSAGKFSMVGNWQVKFSDIEGKPKTYNVQFVCIKGARVLWIDGTAFGRKE